MLGDQAWRWTRGSLAGSAARQSLPWTRWRSNRLLTYRMRGLVGGLRVLGFRSLGALGFRRVYTGSIGLRGFKGSVGLIRCGGYIGLTGCRGFVGFGGCKGLVDLLCWRIPQNLKP